jgi:hypothetical protein
VGLKKRSEREDGGVLILVAIVLPLLLLVSAGGISGFSLYASNRELQRASDQAALAAAAAIPPADPNVLVSNAPFPLDRTSKVYKQLAGLGVDGVPTVDDVENLMRDLIPDPRAVACAIGSDALSTSESAAAVTAFGEKLDAPFLDDDGNAVETVCPDTRIQPILEPNPDNTTPVECTNRLVQKAAAAAGPLELGGLALPSVLQSAVDRIVKMPLNNVLPAAFTPRVKVTSYSTMRPPLVSFITGHDTGTMRATGVAYRRFKNAVVVPILPAAQLQINLGSITSVQAMVDQTNLNLALHSAQKPLIDAITDADNRLSTLMGTLGVPCQHLLQNMRQDLRDIYDPPTGPAPTALDIVNSAVTAAESTAAATGLPLPDPTSPDSLSGEAFMLIGVAVDNFMKPIAATQIPILDVALVTMSRMADGRYKAAVVSAANAWGTFRATLVQ